MVNNTWSGARPSVTKPVYTRFHTYITFFLQETNKHSIRKLTYLVLLIGSPLKVATVKAYSTGLKY